MNYSVSIIIPARNEEHFIVDCIKSILNQSYPINLIQIVVVDGNSTDGTVKVVEGFLKDNSNILLLNNPKCITPISMNIGIKNSIGDVVIILGAHSYIDKDFVKNNVRNLYEKGADCSGGVIETINDGILGESIAKAMSCPFGVGNALFRYCKEEKYVDTVPFGAYKRSTLDKIGYFDEELVRNQDDEINLRLTKYGGKILLSPDIKSTYYSRPSLKKLWKQYFQYGFWKVRVIQKHKRPASLRHLVPPMFAAFLIIFGIGSVFSKFIFKTYTSIILLYLLIDLFFSIKLSLKDSLKEMLYLPLIFPILHISYGLGFLLGLANFYILKSENLKNSNTNISR